MKRKLIFIVMGLFVLAACKQKDDSEKLKADSIRLVEMEAQYEDASNFNDSLLLLMGDIYAGLDSINVQEGILMKPGIGDNADRRAEIKNNLAAIRQRLEHNKRLVAELEKKIKDGEVKNKDQSAVLLKTIEQMKERLAEQDKKIDLLTKQLAEAQETITNLTGQVEETQQQLAQETQAKEQEQAAKEAAQAQVVETQNAANEVYYVIGTNKQLKDWKVLEKRFLGATKVMQGDNINYSCFKKVDKRTFLTIPTGAKKVEIKSLNDKASYVIEGGKDENKTIKITNPELFWQKTPYLVIETK